MTTSASKRRVRIVGFLDILLTVALLIQLICCVIFPLLLQQKVVVKKCVNKTRPDHWDVENNSFWILSFFGLSFFFASIPVLSATSLILSTSPKVENDQRIEMTRFWMNCNIFMIFLDGFAMSIVALVHFYNPSVWIPIPPLIYLACRLIFTVVIRKHMNELYSSTSGTKDEKKTGDSENNNNNNEPSNECCKHQEPDVLPTPV